MFSVFRSFLSGFIIRVSSVVLLWIISIVSQAAVEQDVKHNDVSALKVVTTFSILADMVQQIGGAHVNVHTLVDWDEDAHVFQPSPDDVKKIADAHLLVLNGLGFEGWLARLVSAAEYKGASVEASQGVQLLLLDSEHADHDDHSGSHEDEELHENEESHDHSHKNNVYDPHAWHSLRAALIYVDNIAKSLIKLDPANSAVYSENLMRYSEKLRNLELSIRKRVAEVPEAKRRLIVPHNAFAYLARDYHLQIHSLQGVSTDSEASAADLAKIIRLIRSLKVYAIFTETISDKRLIRVIESETDAKVEGSLVSGALSRKWAPSYLEMMEYNTGLIIKALSK